MRIDWEDVLLVILGVFGVFMLIVISVMVCIMIGVVVEKAKDGSFEPFGQGNETCQESTYVVEQKREQRDKLNRMIYGGEE